jgi:hypothetical protein
MSSEYDLLRVVLDVHSFIHHRGGLGGRARHAFQIDTNRKHYHIHHK